MSEIIKTEQVTYNYQDDEGRPVVALNGVDLEIGRGEGNLRVPVMLLENLK